MFFKKSEKGFTQHHFKNNGNIPRIIKSGAGFTIIELLVAIGVLAVLMGIATINLAGAKRNVSLDTAVIGIMSDLKSQQTKAMAGEEANSYGVYFETDKYTLFSGSAYVTGKEDNFVVENKDIQFTNVLLPDSQIIFASGSGEILNFTQGSNSFSFTDNLGVKQKTVTLNRYGVVTAD